MDLTNTLVLCFDTGLKCCGLGLDVFSRLLGMRCITRIGGGIGVLAFCLQRTKRRILERQIARLFGNDLDLKRIRRISKNSFINYHKRQIETALLGSFDGKIVQNSVTVHGVEHLDRALGKQKGVILLLSHFGSFLLPLPTLGHMGYKISQVTGKAVHTSIVSERIWLWRKKRADAMPVNFIQVGEFLRPIYVSLKKNEIITLAFDGRDGSKWIDTDFIGARVCFSTGPFDLAWRTGATIIPTFVFRKADDSQHIQMHEPFRLTGGLDRKSAVRLDVQCFGSLLAAYVKRYPCHFAMILYNYKRLEKKGLNRPFFIDE